MTNLGRVVATVFAALVLVTVTAVAVHFLKKPKPPAPVIVETPVGDLSGEEVRPARADEGPEGDAALEVPGQKEQEGEEEDAIAPAEVSEPAGPGEALADEGLALFDEGRLVEAQKQLSRALRAGVAGPKGRAVRDALGRCADALQLAPRRHPADTYARSYEVVPGDTLTAIGQKFLVPYQLIMRVNRLESTRIIAGQTLKAIQGPIHLEIVKSRYELRAWLDEVCLGAYPVGLGIENSTPEGTFVVEQKIANPPYQPQHKPRSEFRDAGAPDNPLGSRWIDIGNHYGIHGTIEPSSIGGAVSEGCVRMHNRDVEEVYDFVVPGVSKVEIRP
jgi:LysM repeat protein